MTLNKDQMQELAPRPGARDRKVAKYGGSFLGHLLGGMVSKLVIALVLALAATYVGVAKIAHLNSFSPHSTISTAAVLGRLTKIEQVHVATRTYRVNVTITQSVGGIPCFLICNHMELKGSGTDDAIVDLTTLSKRDVSIDQATAAVTIWMAPPAIGPAILNPAACSISGGHGILNTPTQAFRNNPNGYRPLYVAAESRIHYTALHDPGLLRAGEESTRELLARVLGFVGVKKVTVEFS